MNLECNQTEFCDYHKPLLERLDLFCDIPTIAIKIAAGELLLYDIRLDGVFEGCFVCRIDILLDGRREFCHMFTVSNKKHIMFYKMVNVFVERIARKSGLKTIRVHSQKAGTDRLIERLGFKKFETVFIKKLEDEPVE